MNPKVSVIIPNYCHAKYLDQRIQSVLNQTYQDFEVIILDDASPDNGASRAVIEKYHSNPHVSHIVYNEVNSGSTFKQWNKGFELATGDIIWIAESDDYCELNFLETLIPCWEKYPSCSVIESSSMFVNSKGENIYPFVTYSGETKYFSGIEFIQQHLVKSCYSIPNASAVLFKKEIAISICNEYMDYKASGDRLFWIYLLEEGDMCQIERPLNYFRQHDNKVSNKKELDGTQCRENYRINSYLHSMGYIKGKIKIEEYLFYYIYIKSHSFSTKVTKSELKKLWFPWWRRSYAAFKITQICYWVYKKYSI